ncbi:iron complex transport system permease protein [Lipingzhangella halophila]|uniref:Iron complex transport system permease protein n=1 Tax=Lipingzhangella halophila TaxID=1783352 RepID=A0A7W7RF12_9ACTN|nr:iron chelate uptake ABC transporter family permease subunit [Lipingzhangella halophila]MBB4930620.1 iron complex transport system permease protein [Lipingzhangella halophila]
MAPRTLDRPARGGDRSPRAVVARARRRRAARVVLVTLGLAGVCATLFCLTLSFGEVVVPLPDVMRTLLGTGNGGSGFIINQLRLPRALVGIMVGSAFGISGAIFQTLLRNPLASPDIIGISAGASAAAVVAVLWLDLGGYAVSAAAFAGALATAAMIYTLAWRDGVTGYRLVLVGIAMAAVMTSVVSYSLTRAEVYAAYEALVWLTGSLNATTWPTVRVLGTTVAVLVPLALLAGRWLRALQLGDDAARALGASVQACRLGLLVAAVALAAVATAAAGPVAFVAFFSGPIARQLVGNNGVALVPAAFVGAVVVLASDFVAQHALESVQLPVGVVTAMIGAPYLLWLLATTNRVGRGG